MTADIGVSSVTYSIKLVPFLDAAWLKQGAFAAITDLAAPWQEDSFAVLDQIAIDDLQQEAALPNKLLSPELVTGEICRAKPGQCKECIYI
jgi:ornithine cyclodeaminase/alanine dehydrogenase